jgi:hypothetical protein
MDLNEHEFYMLIICEKGMAKAGDACLRITNLDSRINSKMK